MNAYPGCAQRPRFLGLAGALIEAEEVGVMLPWAAAESAKLAAYKADVGEVDVAIDDVGHEIPNQFRAQFIRRHQQADQVVAFAVRQEVAFIARNQSAVLRSEHALERGAHCRRQARCNLCPLDRRETLQFRLRKGSTQDAS